MGLTYYYAQVDVNGRCFAVTSHAVPLPELPHLVRLDFYDESRLGMIYANGAWLPA